MTPASVVLGLRPYIEQAFTAEARAAISADWAPRGGAAMSPADGGDGADQVHAVEGCSRASQLRRQR
jgi:hypothetical protein